MDKKNENPVDTLEEIEKYTEQTLTSLAKNLVIARNQVGLTQEALAEASGLSRSTIAQIERGEGDPGLKTLIKLATTLEISPVLLLLSQTEIKLALREVAGREMQKLTEHVSSQLSQREIEKMKQMAQSGMPRRQMKAHEMAIKAAVAATVPSGSFREHLTRSFKIGVALGVAGEPGVYGTAIGTILSRIFARSSKKVAPEEGSTKE